MKLGSMKSVALLVAFAAGLIGSLGSANAGGQIHRMPADANQANTAYDIRVVTMPGQGRPLTVQVINKNTRQAVTNAQVTMRHWTYAHIKGAPLPQNAMIPLDPDGHGGYVCTREHVGQGEHIIIRAQVPGEPPGTLTELTIDS